MSGTQPLVQLIEQMTGSMDVLEQLLDDEVDRRIHHPEELTLVVACCLEAQYAVADLLPRLRTARRMLRRAGQSLVSEASDPSVSAAGAL